MLQFKLNDTAQISIIAMCGVLCLLENSKGQAPPVAPNAFDTALAHFDKKEFGLARQAFAHIASTSDDSASVENARHFVARTYLEERDYFTFRQAVQAYCATYPEHEHADFLRFQAALIPHIEGNWQEAAQSFSHFMLENPTSSFFARAAFLRVKALFDCGNYGEFIAAFDEFQSKYPAHPDLAFLSHHKSLAFYNQSDWNEAVKAFAAFRAAFPDSPYATKAHFLQCRSLFESSKYDEFVREACAFRSLHPDDPDLHFLVHHQGLVAHNQHNWDQAISLFQQFSDDFPQSEFILTAMYLRAHSLLEKSQALRDSGHPSAANELNIESESLFTDFRAKVTALLSSLSDPGLVDRYEYELIKSWYLQNDFSSLAVEADKYCKRYASNPSRRARGLLYLGIAQCLDDDNIASAAQNFEMAIDADYTGQNNDGMLDHTLATAICWMIWCTERLGDREASKAYYRKLQDLRASERRSEALNEYKWLLE